MKNKKNIIYCFLLFSILLVAIFISGCGSILHGKLGFVDIKTNPTGAKILIDGKDTGKITPYTFGNLSIGNHVIELIYGEMKYAETTEISIYRTAEINIDFNYKSELIKIKALPSFIHITLSLGNSSTIDSVTAYYRNGTSKSIPISNCNYTSSNTTYVNVNKNGIITGNSTGAAVITVSYTENDKTVNDSILVYVRNTPEDSPIVPNW